MRSTVLLPLLLLAACGGDDAPADDGLDAGDAPDADTSRAVVGSIELVEDHSVFDSTDYRSSGVVARFFDGEAPRFHREAMRSGACTLATYTPSLCTPACTDGLCVETNVCEPWPTLVSAGRLTITGLRAALTLEPQDGYYYSDGALPEDLFDDAARVTASLAGAEIAALSVDADAVAPMVAAINDGKITVPHPAGADFVIGWIPAGDGSRVRVMLNSNNLGHGQPFLAILTCDVADAAGQVALPAEMLDAFPATDAWEICAGTDCPRSTIARYRRGAAPVGSDREVELVIASQLSFGVVHPRN